MSDRQKFCHKSSVEKCKGIVTDMATSTLAGIVLGSAVTEFAADENIRRKVNDVLGCILEAVREATADAVVPAVEQRLDVVVASANDSLRRVLQYVGEAEEKGVRLLDGVNQEIDAVRVGAGKIDADGRLNLYCSMNIALMGRMAWMTRQCRLQLESENLPRLPIADSIALLSDLEKKYSSVYRLLDTFRERVVIHDAMTEKPVSHAGIPELDALNA